MSVDDLLNLILWFPVFIFSTTVHEAAHAWVAMRGGDRTAYEGGQVSLDPLPHIRREPFGMVVMPLLSGLWSSGGYMLGWASTPYDPSWEMRHPKRAALMSLAGPAANFLLVVLTGAAIHACIAAGVMKPPDVLRYTHLVDPVSSSWGFAAKVLSMMFTLNLLLMVFNLLPVPPLDGSGIVPLFLSPEATQNYQAFVRSGRLGLIGLVAAMWIFNPLFSAVYPSAIGLLYPSVDYF